MEKTIRERRQERHALIGATEFGAVYDTEFVQGAPDLSGRFQPWLATEELLAGPLDAIRDGHVHPLRGLQEGAPSRTMDPPEFREWAERIIEQALAAVQTSPRATEPLLALALARANLLKRLVGLAVPILEMAAGGD